MLVNVNRKEFTDAFHTASMFTGNKNSAAHSVMLSQVGREVFLLATDYQTGVSIRLPQAETAGALDGSFWLPAKTSDLLRELTADGFSIEDTVLKGNARCRFKSSGRSVWELETSGNNPDDFPPLFKVPQNVRGFSIESHALKSLIDGVEASVDTESSRYALGVVYLEPEGRTLHAVSTDGRRMTTRRIDVEWSEEQKAPALWRVEAARKVAASLAKDPLTKVSWDKDRVYVQQKDRYYFSRQVEGRYPRWRDVFDRKGRDAQPFMLPAEQLAAAVRQASIVATVDRPGVIFTITDDELLLRAETADKGQSAVSVPVSYRGRKVRSLKISHKYLRDFLGSIDTTKDITFDAADDSQALMLSAGVGDQYASFLAMPLTGE